MNQNHNFIKLIISLSIFCAISFLMISSNSPSLLPKQIISWIIGIGLFFIAKQLSPAQSQKNIWYLYLIAIFLLLIPLVFNNFTRGSRRWISIGPLNIQPSEITKPVFLLHLANFQNPLPLLVPFFLIALQPDLGSALSLAIFALPLILYNKKIFKICLILGATIIILYPILSRVLLKDYQKHRIETFLNPNLDPLGKGYNVIQSKIAFGSGGFWGKGYKKGSQGQLLFLPEKHTDFMFAATAEELGFFSITIILFAYYLLISTLINKAYTCTSLPLFYYSLGLALQIWFQLFVNIGMNIGIMPITGVPLPFISVGGSSIMAFLFSLGIIFSN